MEKNLTTGSVFKAILTFALPYLLSYFLQTLYGMADLYITGRFCGVDSITAVANGSMFVWAPIPAKYAKSMDFCLELVEKSGVLCTPGSSFGPLGEGYVRFALTLPPERIAEAVNSIKESGILN